MPRAEAGRAAIVAIQRRLTLAEIGWLPNPAQPAPYERSETYTLVVTAREKLERQVFSRQDLEETPGSEEVRNKIGKQLRDLVTALLA